MPFRGDKMLVIYFLGGPYDGMVETRDASYLPRGEMLNLGILTDCFIHSYEGFRPAGECAEVVVYHKEVLPKPKIGVVTS